MKQKNYISEPICLEFANNFSHAKDFNYQDLVTWSKNKGAISANNASELIDYSGSFPFKTSPFIYEAQVLANSLTHIFECLTQNHSPLQDDMDFLNGAIKKVFPNLLISPSPSNTFHWNWQEPETPDPGQPLWRVILSAGEMLVEAKVERIKKCAGPKCEKLFLDTSKGGRRKWCSMETCGNQVKVRRYREKGTSI